VNPGFSYHAPTCNVVLSLLAAFLFLGSFLLATGVLDGDHSCRLHVVVAVGCLNFSRVHRGSMDMKNSLCLVNAFKH